MQTFSQQRDPFEILTEKFLEENREGAAVTIEQFAARHPHFADRIRTLFPTLLMLESMRCPADTSQQRHDATPSEFENPPRPATPCPRRIGEFRIVREIGRGGMGIVYEAIQPSLGRIVALKVLSPALLHSPQQVQRFRREARAAARLHHTNIVPVFGSGEQDGVHFYLMQYIDGEGVDEILAGDDAQVCPVPVRGNWQQIAHIGLQIASALAHAHAQGICHRDVKPANILLDESGVAWITDFGLAKAVEHEAMTAPGDAVGTLHYMAPEQIDGQGDARSDLYSLGVTLYEMLTWRPAFDQRNRARLVQQVLNENPVRPRKLDPSIPLDLETIILKACAKAPQRRYQTAGEMVHDLNRFLADRPVRARRVSTSERVWRWSRRNPALAVLTFLTAALLVSVATVSAVAHVNSNQALARETEQNQIVQQESKRADDERDRAEANLRLAMKAFDEICDELAPGSLPMTPSSSGDSMVAPPFVPATSGRTAKVLKKLLAFYDRFVEQNGEYPELKHELMRAHRRVGDIQLQLGQFAEAESAYRRAVVLHDQCCPNNDCELSHAVDGAALRIDLAALLQTTNRAEEAEQQYAEARTSLQSLSAQHPTSTEVRYELARAYKLTGDLLHLVGDMPGWSRANDQAIEILEQLVAADPKPPEYRYLLACAEANRPPIPVGGPSQRHGPGMDLRCEVGPLDHRAGGPQHDRPHQGPRIEGRPQRDGEFAASRQQPLEREPPGISKAIQLLEPLVEEYPEETRYRFELSQVYAKVPLWQPGPKQHALSDEELSHADHRLRQALPLCRELAETYPSVPQYADALACTLGKLGSVADQLGDEEEGESCLQLAVAQHRTLTQRFPNVPSYRNNLATSEHQLGQLLFRQERYQESHETLDSSIDDRLAFLDTAPDNRPAREQLADQYLELAQVCQRLGEHQQAWEAELHAQLVADELRPDRGWPHDHGPPGHGPPGRFGPPGQHGPPPHRGRPHHHEAGPPMQRG